MALLLACTFSCMPEQHHDSPRDCARRQTKLLLDIYIHILIICELFLFEGELQRAYRDTCHSRSSLHLQWPENWCEAEQVLLQDAEPHSLVVISSTDRCAQIALLSGSFE